MKTRLFNKVFWMQATAVIMIVSMLMAGLPVQTTHAAPVNVIERIGCLGGIGIVESPALVPQLDPLTVTELDPNFAAEGGPDFTLTVIGTGFGERTIVLWEKAGIFTELITTFISSTELQAEVPAELISIAHEVPFVTVCNPYYTKINAGPTNGFSIIPVGLPFFLTKTGAQVLGFELGIGEDPSASFAGVTADGNGIGTLVVAQYASNPAPGQLLFGLGDMYYDVHIGPNSNFTQVTIQFCGESALLGLVYFWNGSQWVQPSDQSMGPVGCLSIVVTDTTVPSLADLSGGLFGTLPIGLLVDDGRHHFADVPPTHWAWPWVTILADAGITNGCSTLPYFCPEDPVTRAQMAIFLERGMHGAAYNPPTGTGTVFADVPLSYGADSWIEKLYADGITGGCLASPLSYCPDNSVTRAEMAIFLLRAKYGATYTPPVVGAGTGFNDVSTSYWDAAWIKQLAAEGITSGCGGGNYCPENLVTRAEMAKFLVLTFNLP